MSGVTVGGPSVTRRSARTRQKELRPLGTLNRAFRYLVGVGMLAAGAYLIVIQEQFRYLEAAVVTALLKPFLGAGVFQFADQFVVRLDATHYLGLQITVECTTLVLLTPMLLFSAAVLMFTRVTWPRWALATLIGFSIVVVVNAIRIALIAFSTLWWDEAGYEWSHILIGTLVALIGLVGAALLMLRIMNGSRRAAKSQRKAETPEPDPEQVSS